MDATCLASKMQCLISQLILITYFSFFHFYKIYDIVVSFLVAV
jgi:hypothetical protein